MADAERPQRSEEPRPRPLPSLPREALKRIEAAEREAREQLSDDIWPYSSHNPKFSFLEESIIRSTARTRDFIRVYAEDILGVRLREHLDFDPSQLLRNNNLLASLCDEVKSLAETAWEGYICGLQFEPSRRDAIFAIARAEGKKLPQWSVIPRQEQWNQLLTKWSETDCKMRRVIDQFDPMILNVLTSQIRRYKKDAARKLGINESAEAGEPAQTEPPAVGAVAPVSPPQGETPTEKPQLRWQDIQIRFTSDFQVQITTPQGSETRNYAEMGFEDQRKQKVGGSKPTQGWVVFKGLAIKDGVLETEELTGKERGRLEKAIQNIREKLRSTFSPVPEGDPIQWDRRGRCFRAMFSASYPDHERL